MSPDSKDEKELRVILKKSTFQKLDKIRRYYGLKNLAEIVRLLITTEYRRIEEKDLNPSES